MCYGRNSRRPAKLPNEVNGGGRGIRTPGTLSGTAVFKTACFNRSHIPPHSILTVREQPSGVAAQVLRGRPMTCQMPTSRYTHRPSHTFGKNSSARAEIKEYVCELILPFY